MPALRPQPDLCTSHGPHPEADRGEELLRGFAESAAAFSFQISDSMQNQIWKCRKNEERRNADEGVQEECRRRPILLISPWYLGLRRLLVSGRED